MPYHHFTLYKKHPTVITNFMSNRIMLNEKSYPKVRISDDIIREISFRNVETYYNYYRKKYCKNNLNYYGIPIIPPSSLGQFLKILKSQNKDNCVLNDLIKITEEALENNYYIIHFGI